MLTNSDRETAVELIRDLIDRGLLSHLIKYGENSLRSWFNDLDLGSYGFGASGGETKACIWHDDLSGWVIKVGYAESVSCDYATVEYENYIYAVNEGFTMYFPETVYLGQFCGRKFYAQRFCECNEEAVSSDWYERLRDRYDEDGEEYDCDRIWEELDYMDDYEKALLMFGDERFCEFLYKNGIGDLHEGNFGYVQGCPVIIDFSGYRG